MRLGVHGKKTLFRKHALPTMRISLNRDVGLYGNFYPGCRKSVYGLIVAKTSDWKQPHCRDWQGYDASNRTSNLAGCKSALIPTAVYSTDHSQAVVPVLVLFSIALFKAVVLVLFLLFVALWFPHCFLFFYMCCDASIVVTVFTTCPLCFLFTSCVVMLAFWSPLTAAHSIF